MLGRVKKIKNYDKFGKVLKDMNLKKYENIDEKREMAVNIIERWVTNSLAKMRVKKMI